ncbi:MAG: hypothetical protein HY365_00335 [Candidatus Aenigmarchaeota archaeon]|nr:hypothetical protein [Candidatus Aenigmarchaeota archaeon]
MHFKYAPGFVTFESGKPGPIFVAPHSSLTYRSAEREDVGSENVAFLAAQHGGSAVISCIPRHGILGIDFNRAPPRAAMRVGDAKSSIGFYRKYAWAAQTSEEHRRKGKIYSSFWKAVERLGVNRTPFFVFCHTLSSRAKNLPSVIDLVTGRGKWANKRKVEQVVSRLNAKRDFQKYKEDWKRDMAFHAMQGALLNAKSGMRRLWLNQDIARASELSGMRLSAGDFGTQRYFRALDKALDNARLKITVENIYSGDTALPVAPLLKKTGGAAIEVESQSFLNENHAEDVVKVISEVVKELGAL